MGAQKDREPHAKTIHPAVRSMAGSIGGLLEACCLQPMNTIKTRLQLDRVNQYTGIVNCGRTIIQEEGARSLWNGLTPQSAHLFLKYSLRMGTNAAFQNLLRDELGHLTEGKRLLAGFCAGVTEAVLVVTPFEVVKTRLQQQRGMAPEHLKYKGPVHAASLILQKEGVQGLWSGTTPTIMRNGINQMCLFWAKTNLDQILWHKQEGDGTRLSPVQSMSSGFAAACLGPMITGPFDVVKTRLMAQDRSNPRYYSLVHALVKIPREEGVRALYRGLLSQLLRIPPGQAIMWAVSDHITGHFERTDDLLRM